MSAAGSPKRIERAQLADAAELAAIAKQCGLTVDFPAELLKSYALVLVARAGDEPCGFALAWRAADELHLTDLGVAAAFRRRGVARALLRELFHEAELLGARLVLLEVRASNAPALALYRAAGFVELDRRRGYYAANGEDAVVMQRELR